MVLTCDLPSRGQICQRVNLWPTLAFRHILLSITSSKVYFIKMITNLVKWLYFLLINSCACIHCTLLLNQLAKICLGDYCENGVNLTVHHMEYQLGCPLMCTFHCVSCCVGNGTQDKLDLNLRFAWMLSTVELLDFL